MALIATDTGGGGNFSPMPAGNHLAICNMVVDLGMQKTEYMGEEKTKHQVWVRWETPDERLDWTDKDGNEQNGRRVIGKIYTLSLHENANLRADLESWRGKKFTDAELEGFDISKLLGVACMLNVTHDEKNGKTYANVSAVAPLPKSMSANVPDSELGLLLYDPDTQNTYGDLPEWLQKKINDQIKPTGNTDPNDPDAWRSNDLNDDVPF